MFPYEFLSIPVAGEPDITKSFTSIKQDWCKKLQLYQILDNNFTLRDASLMPVGKHPLEMEINTIQSAIEGKVSSLTAKAHGTSIEGCTRKLRPALGLFNIYGRIVFKQRKRCSSYYRLINESRTKTDCWSNSRLTLEKEGFDIDEIHLYDSKQYNSAIRKILRLKDFSFLKMFGVQILRNNLFLNIKLADEQSPKTNYVQTVAKNQKTDYIL